jgi:hypothetical protein
MNWFQRHLNWSFVLGIVVIPLVVWIIVLLILGLIVHSAVSGMSNPSEDYMQSLWATMVVPFNMIYILLLIAEFVYMFFVTFWYLGQKARSKWFSLLLFAPFGLIILLVLENQAIGYGDDFVAEPATDWRPDTGSSTEYYDRQWRELEHRDVGGAKEASVASGGAPAVTPPEAPTGALPETPGGTPAATPAEAKVMEEAVRQEALNMPILLDDAGVAIKCSYHPDADAVNLCSRCRQYVCSQCNYVTGTHPICRNCWEKRA